MVLTLVLALATGRVRSANIHESPHAETLVHT